MTRGDVKPSTGDAPSTREGTVVPDTQAQCVLGGEAFAELALIRSGAKQYLSPESWMPVPYQATMPGRGVELLPDVSGRSQPVKAAFDGNIEYLTYCATLDNYVERPTMWTSNWPTSNEGRMLMGAGHALRWVQNPTLQGIVDQLVATAGRRQQSNGFAMAWPELDMPDRTVGERANYDRAMWTRGLVAAAMAGNTDAPRVLRRLYDWFNEWVDLRISSPIHSPSLLEQSLGVQGHIGSTLAYFAPAGVDADMVTAERYYVQDWWLKRLKERDPHAVSSYPLDRPHSYLLIGGEAFLDHYRATGAKKYLDGALGMWDIFRDHFIFPGGGTSIKEHNQYPPDSHLLRYRNNELCGGVFWILFNARFLQLFPSEERYAAEIERSIYNTVLPQQDHEDHHKIRYHANLYGEKEPGQAVNTCCEVNGTGLLSRLPEFIYSIDDDGLCVNLYESSRVAWEHHGRKVALVTSTAFPASMTVVHVVYVMEPEPMTLRVRVPSWASGRMDVQVNGVLVASGAPGTYVHLERIWKDGDQISYELPAAFRLERYRGLEQVDGHERYALEYGPLLYALTGAWGRTYEQVGGGDIPQVELDPDQLISELKPSSYDPMVYTIASLPQLSYVPYWKVSHEAFNCFPVVGHESAPDVPA